MKRMKEIQPLQENKVSKTFNISRVVAIVSVIAAHTPFDITNLWLKNLVERFSSIGVVVFIIISGYYFNPKKYQSVRLFMKSKITTIFLPWIIMGTIIFFESKIVTGQPIGFLGWIGFLLGQGSFLYYLTILILCYLIAFFPVKKGDIKALCIVAFIATVISQQLTAWDVVDVSKIHITNYLNVFNWIGYFCVGVFLKEFNVYSYLEHLRKYLYLYLLAWIVLYVLAFYFDSGTGYFSIFAIPLQILGAVIVFGFCSFNFLECSSVLYVAKASFCIYLIHTFFVAIVDKYMGNITVVSLFMPVVTLFVNTSAIYVCEKLAERFNILKLFSCMTGVRVEGTKK